MFSHSARWFSLWNVYRYQPISHSSCSLNCNVWEICHVNDVWFDGGRKYKRCSFECDIGKYSTCPRNKVFAYGRWMSHGTDGDVFCSRYFTLLWIFHKATSKISVYFSRIQDIVYNSILCAKETSLLMCVFLIFEFVNVYSVVHWAIVHPSPSTHNKLMTNTFMFDAINYSFQT